MVRVILVVGHDSMKRGARNELLGVSEFNVVNRIVYEIMNKYHNTKVDVVVKYRNSLSRLPEEINGMLDDKINTVVISLHLNAFNKKVQGEEMLAVSGMGKHLAEILLGVSKGPNNIKQRGVKMVSSGQPGHFILSKVKPVAVLYEPFFLDSVTTHANLDRYVNRTATKMIKMFDTIGEIK